MMGGSGGSGWSPLRDVSKIRGELDNQTKDADYRSEVEKIIQDALSNYNSRDVDAVNKHLDVLSKAISKDIDGMVEIQFGGSVSKHSYVDGLSDIDVLVNVKETELIKKTPKDLLSYFAAQIEKRLPTTKADAGNMALTIKFKDGCEIQLLPAIKTTTGYKVPKADGSNWSNVVRPGKFAEKLTEVNKNNNGKVVPTIKLFKAALSNLPKDVKLSGYHAESLALNAFKNYKGSTNKMDMLRHLIDYTSKNVTKPISDSTGQSVHVDDYLGSTDSTQRRRVSKFIGRLGKKLDAAGHSYDLNTWKEILNG